MKSPHLINPKKWPALHAKLWSLSKIKPYPKNVRLHPPEQVRFLAEIFARRGVDQPIVVDEKGVILKGHGRRLAALEAGFEVYPVAQRLGMSSADKRAMRIEDNQSALLSSWDRELMLGELQSLKADDYDLTTLGFPELTLTEFLMGPPEPGNTDPDTVPPLPKKPVVRAGDIWTLGVHRIMCGDSTSAENVASLLGGARPHLMVTDPPYGVEYDPAWRADANKWKGSKVKIGGKAMGRVSNDDSADWTEAWRMFSGDVAYVWHGGLRSVEQAQSLERAGFHIRSQIIWNKGRLVISRGDYHWAHEACWYGVRNSKVGHWNGSRTESTVWDIPKPQASETGHSTQKPVECMKRPMENNSRPGEFVYDPFVGSGTSIVAAEMTKRRALAMELNPAYVQLSIERWEKFTGKTATLDGKTLDQVAAARRSGRHEASDRRKSIRGKRGSAVVDAGPDLAVA